MPTTKLTSQQRAFVAAYLGVDAGSAPEASDTGGETSVTAVWRDAKEAADIGISALQTAMRTSGIPAFEGLASHGLHSATEGRLSTLMAALMDVDRTGDAASRDKARKAVAEMKSFVEGAKVISLMEKNPLGVAVSIRAPLDSALSRVDTLLSKVGG